MTDAERDQICTLMCLVVLADKKVFMSEIQALVRMMRSLQDATHTVAPLDEASLRDWFADNRFEIEAILASDHRQEKILNLFEKLREFRYKPALLEALSQIAIADDVLHSSEIEILRLGAQTWNIDPPEYLG